MNEDLDYFESYDDISTYELTNVLSSDAGLYYDEFSKPIYCPDQTLEQICNVIILVEKLHEFKSLTLPYKLVKSAFGNQQRYQLQQEFRDLLVFLKSWQPDLDTSHYDCEHYRLFKEVCDEVGIEALQFHVKASDYIVNGDGQQVIAAEHINQFITKLWPAVRSPVFKKMMSDRRDKSRHNLKSGMQLINRLFLRYARLMVCRIDLALRPEYLEGQTVEEMQAYLQRFLNNRRSNALFDHMVGYTWKLENGSKKGLHFHIIMFFDGSEVYKDGYYTQKIGEYWRDSVTKGRGLFYNCNANKSRYRKLGIGMINHDDDEKIGNLYQVLAYLTKSSQFVIVKTLGNYRCFGRSEMPSLIGTSGAIKRGRPRRTRLHH